MSAKNLTQRKTYQELLPEGFVYKEKIRGQPGIEEIILDDNDLEDLDRFGRIFLLYDLLPKDKHDEFIRKSR